MRYIVCLVNTMTCLLALSATSIYAAPGDVREINQVSHGNCSPNIANVRGNVTVVCNSEGLEAKISAMPAIRNYNKNTEKLNAIGKEVGNIKSSIDEMRRSAINKAKISDDRLNELEEKLSNKEKELSDLQKEDKKLRADVAKELAEFKDVVWEGIASKGKELESEFGRKLALETDRIYERIDKDIMYTKVQIADLERRIYKLENDVSYIMSNFLEGNLVDSVGFFSGSAGAWKLKDNWVPKFGAEYERLLPGLKAGDVKFSVFGELAWLSWTERLKFETLPGAPASELKNDHDIVYLSIGTRVFLPSPLLRKWDTHLHNYLLLSGGHSIAGSEKDAFTYAFGAGVEYTRKTTRASLEISWEGFTNVEQTTATFNAFGNARIERSGEHLGGLLLAARLAF